MYALARKTCGCFSARLIASYMLAALTSITYQPLRVLMQTGCSSMVLCCGGSFVLSDRLLGAVVWGEIAAGER